MEIKEHYGCAHCDEVSICCLTFHHIDAKTKNRKICKCLSNFSKSLIKDEVNKCIVLCFNCHAKVEKNLLQIDHSKRCHINEHFQISKYTKAVSPKKAAKSIEPPEDWHEHHHADCGTQYRGCHPTLCPKNQYEETGIWKFRW